MSIYLVQHGKALSKDEDHLKPLSKSGRAVSEFMAQLVKDKGINVSKIIHSSKLRSIETAEIFNNFINTKHGIVFFDGLNPKDNVKQFGDNLDQDSNLMIIGHLPFLDRLIGYLITGAEESRILRFQNSCVVCIDKIDQKNKWWIKWTLMPHVD